MMISSTDLFFSRDCGVGAGPAVDAPNVLAAGACVVVASAGLLAVAPNKEGVVVDVSAGLTAVDPKSDGGAPVAVDVVAGAVAVEAGAAVLPCPCAGVGALVAVPSGFFPKFVNTDAAGAASFFSLVAPNNGALTGADAVSFFSVGVPKRLGAAEALESSFFCPRPENMLDVPVAGAAASLFVPNPANGEAAGVVEAASLDPARFAKRLFDVVGPAAASFFSPAPPKRFEAGGAAFGVDPNRLGFSVVGVEAEFVALFAEGKLKVGGFVAACADCADASGLAAVPELAEVEAGNWKRLGFGASTDFASPA